MEEEVKEEEGAEEEEGAGAGAEEEEEEEHAAKGEEQAAKGEEHAAKGEEQAAKEKAEAASPPRCNHSGTVHYSWWNKHVANPIRLSGYGGDGARAMGLLRGTILEACMLRRTK